MPYFLLLNIIICKLQSCLSYNLVLNFKYDLDGIGFTSKTVKNLTELPHWRPETHLHLYRLTQPFNFEEFCDLIKKGFFTEVVIWFATDASIIYRENVKAMFKKLKKNL